MNSENKTKIRVDDLDLYYGETICSRRRCRWTDR